VATLAQREIRSANEFLRALIVMTLVGGVIGLPIGYALSGIALRPVSEAVRERSAFVALASHQLRTPLSVIRISAELAKAGKGLSHDEALTTILEQTGRMEALAARLTALARAEARTEERRGRADLTDTAATVIAALGPAATHAGITLHLDAAGPVRTLLSADELTDVLTPLIENAVRFSPPGGTVTVRVLADRDKAIAEVVDQGPGIAPEDLPHVSRPFFQGRRARGGFGLGLAIVRAVVDRNRGRLSIESDPGRGTTVRVLLPMARDGGA
jgi:two-component system sensor histidine kinase TctE